MTKLQWDQWSAIEVDDENLPLVKNFYKTCGISFKYSIGERVFVLRGKNNDNWSPILGAVRFQPEDDSFLLRSLCVDPTWRRNGLARQLLQLALARLSFPCCYSFALSHLRDLYASFDFTPIEINAAPPAIAKAYVTYRKNQRNLLLMKYGG